MSIVRKIEIDGQDVLFKASAAIPRIYRLKFQRDIYKDLRILEKSIGEGDEENSNLDLFSLEMFENIAYTMAKHADPQIPNEVDEWLDADGLRPYFKTVQQSSVTYIRKPGPAIYYYAMEEVGARPENCCYVGDNLNRDIVGAKAVDFGMTVTVQYDRSKPLKLTEENMPDGKIYTFPQLLDIFPEGGKVAVDKLIAPNDGQ